jgi:aryl sulfotransferase
MTGGIFWLASYPKSGNTWTRSFINALLNKDPDQELDINALNTGAIASSRHWLESGLGFDIDQLDHDEVDNLRPFAYRWLAKRIDGYSYHKVHDAYTNLPNGLPLFPKEATAGALQIVRNPLDVAVSYASHNGESIEKSIRKMGNPRHAFCASENRCHPQIRQWLLSWSHHVRSWQSADFNVLTVRYEDMKSTPEYTFQKMAEFLQLPSDGKSVRSALEKCHFNALKIQEENNGFKEKPVVASSFFRKGIVGDWKNTLTDEQIANIIEDHGEVMVSLGYLDNSGSPTT